MNFFTAFGLAIVIAICDCFCCWFVIVECNSDLDEMWFYTAILNGLAFVLTLTISICKFKFGIL